MENSDRYIVRAGEDFIFGEIVDVIQSQKASGNTLLAVKVSVNPSRFGVDEAISVRLRSSKGEGEIGKILIRPIDNIQSQMTVPVNRTGGAEPPELDPEGKQFENIRDNLLKRLEQLGLYVPLSPPETKEPIGFRRPQ